MLDFIETLLAVKELGTMGKAAARLRITQSAVSKRIKSLEAEYGQPLLEAEGRRVRLTNEGEILLLKIRPLLLEIKACMQEPEREVQKKIIIGVSESLMASTAPVVLERLRRSLPQLSFELHAHRTPIAVEHVRSGEYSLALCAEDAVSKDLEVIPICKEPMVIIPSHGKKFRWGGKDEIQIISIESSSATWLTLLKQIPHFTRKSGVQIVPTMTLESFTSIAQMAKAGFGHGLVPWGIAWGMGLEKEAMSLPMPGLHRQVAVIGRKGLLAQPLIQQFTKELQRGFSELDYSVSQPTTRPPSK
ncbi:MAG TPA: LysR family transcriptional regulator [Bdellovibrio sp.]|uniref:LysR family transcriptional regulator n=1 Tax=Bdellovibrio sp. TaxID=28201 RepID=UPI002EE84E67